jgi:hypothetical protein
MLPSDSELLTALNMFYADLQQAPTAARRVGWESDAAHRFRLRAILDVLQPLDHIVSVLDAGAGEARLLDVLREAGFRGRYRGEEMLQHHVVAAAARHRGDADAAIFVANALGDGPSAEVVVCSGTLNTRAEAGPGADAADHGPDLAHEAFVLAAIDRLWQRAEAMLVVDLAILDRHAAGFGLGRVRIGVVLDHLRALAPVVACHEDVVPGECLFVASRRRGRSVARRLPEAHDRAEVLVAWGEGDAALAALEHMPHDAGTSLLVGQAHALEGRFEDAAACLEPLLSHADAKVADAATVALAQVRFRQKRSRDGLALLESGARRNDDARAHLAIVHALMGRADDARRAVATIGDAWIRRDVERSIETTLRRG